MTSKLYVGNIPYSMTETSLEELFAKSGSVTSVKIITDKYSGRSKGFAFVEMSSTEEATTAMENLNGTEYEGRTLKIDRARPQESRSQRNNKNY